MKFSKLANIRPDTIPLTQEKYDQLVVEKTKHMQTEADVLVRLATAREQGDLSENGAYKYAKFELGNVRRELKRINHLLRWGKVVSKTSTDTVDFGKTITLTNGDKQIIFTLVSEHESNPSKKMLSTKSPYGMAVWGKAMGDEVSVLAPAGEFSFTITDIS